ncbi:PRPF39 [Lepeophtheirus salmonis]|uniref:PRPF39 n=1 Tax=Lepeophtheirus salmonis TaxID=72036 RepID=A0A7R8H1U0_LEPSM|nr:PRPF39 [Lepeophtheirus salmonis]CAF2800759.1 PRPF39 [Lepeophtheirus salmonis]
MKPLERGQLKNWSEYLDFEIGRLTNKVKKKRKSSKEETDDQGEDKKEAEEKEEEDSLPVDDTRVEILFERCLIACALYEEFWFKYIDWLSKRKGDNTEMIRSVYRKACEHHLRGKVDIHLRRAEFEEKLGNLLLASEILSKLESKHPEAVGFSLKRINLERRQGNHDQVRKLFGIIIEKKSGSIRTEIAVKYARYLRLCHGDMSSALQILQDAIPHDEKNPKIYLQILNLHLHSNPIDLEKITILLDSAMDKLESAKTKNAQLRKEHRAVIEESSNDKSEEGKKDEDSSNSTSNSASYNAHHNSQYQQYGARYSSNYNYNGSGYGSYYQGYGGSYAGY